MKSAWRSYLAPLCDSQSPMDASLVSLQMGDTAITLSAQDVHTEQDGSFRAQAEAGGLLVEVTGEVYPGHRAAQWVVWLENRGGDNTPLISRIRAADLCAPMEPSAPLTHSGIRGDSCSGDSFLPFEEAIVPGSRISLAPAGGRSSSGEFPFFDLTDGDGGVTVAIGWSGQWQYDLSRDEGHVRLEIGLQDACFYLKPGERVRLPRVLVKAWEGDIADGHNAFRALMRERFAPRAANGELVSLPAALQCFDRYVNTLPRWATEAGQKECARLAARVGGIDTLWLDAAWFEGGFPFGVGNYRFQSGFPNGLKPVSDEAHGNGLKFMVWFEPERVEPGTDVDRSHGDWIIRRPPEGKEDWGGLLDLSRPEAVDWLTETLTAMLRDNGSDIYRQDFNMDPLPFWRLRDEDGRRGLTEIGHITGLYRLWDALRARFPGLVIDNCSSGGRRMDLETCMRSVPLWRSDTGCAPDTPERPASLWNQNQALSLSNYLPFQAIAAWSPEARQFRPAATEGIACNFDVLSPDFDFEKAGECMAEFQRLKKYWTGDFYPLARASLDTTEWSGFQLHRSDLDAGAVMLFRRADCPEPSHTVRLRGLRPDALYRLTLSDENRTLQQTELSGQTLAQGVPFTIARPGDSLAVEYTAIGL